ncbi:MAG: hypothetical protein Q9165_006502 [Trypethelium subeluteriae]
MGAEVALPPTYGMSTGHGLMLSMAATTKGPLATLSSKYAVSQMLAVPPQLRSIDPQWAHCALNLVGLYDPPYALTQAGSAAGPYSGVVPVPNSNPQPAPVSMPQPNSAPMTTTADPPLPTQTNKLSPAWSASSNDPARGSAPAPAPAFTPVSEDPKNSRPGSVNVDSIVPSILGGGGGRVLGGSGQQDGGGNAKSEAASTPASVLTTSNGKSDDPVWSLISSVLDGDRDPNAISGSGSISGSDPGFLRSDLGHAPSSAGRNTDSGSGSNGDLGTARSGSDSGPSGSPVSILNPGSGEGDPYTYTSTSGSELGSGSSLGSGVPGSSDAVADNTNSALNSEASGSGGKSGANSKSSDPGAGFSNSRFVSSSRFTVSGGATSISAVPDGSNGIVIEGSTYQPGQSATFRDTPISIGTDAVVVPGRNGDPPSTMSILSVADGDSGKGVTSSSSRVFGAVFYAGGRTYTATALSGSNQAVFVGGTTISPGGSVASLSKGQVVSAAPSGIVILGGASASSQATTIAYSDLAGLGSDATAAAAIGVIVTAANGQSFTARSSAGRISIDGHTIVPGGFAVTLPNGQVVSADIFGLVAGTGAAAITETYFSLPTSDFSAITADFSQAVITLGGSALTVSEKEISGVVVFGGHTLSPGGTAATIDGTVVSVESSGVVVGNAGGRSTSITYSVAVTATSTTFPAGSMENTPGGEAATQTSSGAFDLSSKVLERALVPAFAGIAMTFFLAF